MNGPTRRPDSALVTAAPAKVNLDLRVRGRRSDGYHELTSIVAFAIDAADRVALLPPTDDAAEPPARVPPATLTVDGPESPQLDGPNSITVAADLVCAALQDAGAIAPSPSFRFALEKHLPVAAGIGGGSADAGAALRLMRSAVADGLKAAGPDGPAIDWPAIAARIGADVPVCLESTAHLMEGIGDRLTPLLAPPPFAILLVNPRIATPTGPVFQALAAPPLGDPASPLESRLAEPAFASALASGEPGPWRDLLRASANDLEAPARALVPEITAVRDAVQATDNVELVRMSGSGATWFGLYADLEAAQRAADAVRRSHPTWWVAPSRLA